MLEQPNRQPGEYSRRIWVRQVVSDDFGCLDWIFVVVERDSTTLAYARSAPDGLVLDLQRDNHAGTTGCAVLDHEIGDRVRAECWRRDARRVLDRGTAS